MGLSKEAQVAMYSTAIEMRSQSNSGPTATLDIASLMRKKRRERTKPLGDPVDIPFRHHDGSVTNVRAYIGETLMDAAKRKELVEATCGGAVECATCHIHLVSSTSEVQAVPVPEPTNEEEDQLEYALFADDNSRLGCQIEITPDLAKWLQEGGRVQLPRY